MVIEPRWEGLNSRKCNWEKRYRSTSSRSRRKYDEERARRDRALNANAYKEMIDSYLTNGNKAPIQEEDVSIKDSWMKTSNLGQKNEAKITSQRVEEEELSEMDKLWQEMEEAMTTCLLEETKVQQLIFPHSLNLFHVLYFFFFVLVSFVLILFSKDDYVLLSNQDSNVVVPVEKEEKSSVVCPHNYRLNEEIGICCIICGDVKIEIKYVFPPFVSEV